MALLEIKCPFIGKTAGIKETVSSQLNECLIKKGENIYLKEKHRYYGQIQLSTAVLNLKLTYFVIYSSFDKQIFTLMVKRNDEFIISMLMQLKKVYYCFMLHNVCLIKQSCDNKENMNMNLGNKNVNF